MPTEPRCKNCRWWGALQYRGNQLNDEARQCAHPLLTGDVRWPENPGDFAVYCDDNEYPPNDLITGRDFGCIKFEADESPESPAGFLRRSGSSHQTS